MADEALLELPELEQVEQPEAVVTDQPEPKGEQALEQKGGDERTLPRWIRDLKSTRTADFTAAKDAFFEQKTMQEKLKDFDLDAVKTWLGEVGGREGIESERQTLTEKAQEYDTILGDIAAGKPEVAARLMEQAGDNSSQVAISVMNEWAKIDPGKHGETLRGVMSDTLAKTPVVGLDGQSQTNLPDLIREAQYALQWAPDADKAQIAGILLDRMGKFVGAMKPGQASPQSSKPNPETDRLKADRAALDQEKTTIFTKGVSDELGKSMTSEIETALKTYIDRDPADKDKRDMAMQNVWSEVNKRLAADKDFSTKWDKYIAAKDQKGALELAAGKRKAILGDISQKIGRTIYGNPAAAKPAILRPDANARRSETSSPNRNGFDEIWAS